MLRTLSSAISHRPASRTYLVLGALVLIGLALRITAAVSWWPAITTVSDSWAYSVYAESNPLANPQHPAGYSALLATIGFVTRDVAVPIVMQHVLGIASAIVLFAAVRRLTGSPWPALIPAAVILLNADQIFLERTIMSEGPFLAVVVLALYACVRAIDAPVPWWRWPATAGALVALAAVFRSTGVFLVPVIALALLFAKPGPWVGRWRAPGAALGVAAVILVGYAFASLISNGRFEVGPTQGWHLYGRVAPFADCGQFDPPAGTARLCERSDPARRPGTDYYLYDPASPATQLYGPEPWREHDSDLGAWARAVLTHQPKTYALAVWRDLRTHFVPTSRPPYTPGTGGDLDPLLEWNADSPGYGSPVREITAGMQNSFFNPFRITQRAGGISFLHDYQRAFRFGATLLVLTTLLTLLGLLIGPRRSRVGVLLFGGGGLSLLLAPTLTVYYTGRYSVPVAPLVSAGSAIAIWTLHRMETGRRHG